MSYHINLAEQAEHNNEYRKVLYTGKESQLVLMSIPPGEEVGSEIHTTTEQTLYFESGTGEGMLNDETFPVGPGVVVVVTEGVRHNFKNTGSEDLKIVTVYAPPHHIDGRIHHTKADADADTADEEYGEKQ